MLHTMKRRVSARRTALLMAGIGCTCASLSGTFAYAAKLQSPVPAERLA